MNNPTAAASSSGGPLPSDAALAKFREPAAFVLLGSAVLQLIAGLLQVLAWPTDPWGPLKERAFNEITGTQFIFNAGLVAVTVVAIVLVTRVGGQAAARARIVVISGLSILGLTVILDLVFTVLALLVQGGGGAEKATAALFGVGMLAIAAIGGYYAFLVFQATQPARPAAPAAYYGGYAQGQVPGQQQYAQGGYGAQQAYGQQPTAAQYGAQAGYQQQQAAYGQQQAGYAQQQAGYQQQQAAYGQQPAYGQAPPTVQTPAPGAATGQQPAASPQQTPAQPQPTYGQQPQADFNATQADFSVPQPQAEQPAQEASPADPGEMTHIDPGEASQEQSSDWRPPDSSQS